MSKTKGFISEFKQFALRGNVIDLAVGIVIGGAFGKIVSSIVNDLIMPLVGMLTSGYNVSELKAVLRDGEVPLTLNYGIFIQNVIDFLIIAFSIFLFVKLMNRLRRTEEKPAPVTPEEVLLLREIRDALQKQGDTK